MDGTVYAWVPASVVAAISLASFAWQRVQNGKDQARLAGRFEQKIDHLCRDVQGLSKSVENHLKGDCPVARCVDRLESRLDEHLKDPSG